MNYWLLAPLTLCWIAVGVLVTGLGIGTFFWDTDCRRRKEEPQGHKQPEWVRDPFTAALYGTDMLILDTMEYAGDTLLPRIGLWLAWTLFILAGPYALLLYALFIPGEYLWNEKVNFGFRLVPACLKG